MRTDHSSARPVYRAAHTRARRRRARARRRWRDRLLALAFCLLAIRGAAFATETALETLFPAPAADAPETDGPAGTAAGWEEARQALEDCLAGLPGQVSVAAVRPSDGLTFTWNETRQYYAASLLKAPYALWLCRQAEAGELDLDQPLAGWEGTAREALAAMIARSDNEATAALYTRWPAREDNGFADFLAELGVVPADKPRALSPETRITGTLSAADSQAILAALAAYFAGGTPLAGELEQAFLAADHEFLVTDWPMAKKYGNWTGALHDIALVYAPDPYSVAVLTDWGDPVEEAPECREDYRALSARLTAYMES